MQPSFRLGRIAGIPISANWSLVALMALLIWVLESGVFPASDPGQSSGVYLVMGVVAAACFVLGILLHEVGHAIQARREGMTIHSITLWLFGGVARFEGFFPSGAAEVRVALAGPAVSLVLGFGLLGISHLSALPLGAQTVIWWLAIINIILGGFNMLPALPLDGGRTLRGAVWAITGSLERATRTAFRISRVVAFGMIAVGIMLAIEFGDAVGGVWLALIGVFVLQAAAAELQASTAVSRTDARQVGDVMHPFAASVTPETPIRDLATAIAHAAPGTAYPVIADDQVVGLFVCDVVHALPPDRQAVARVSDLMIGRHDLTFVEPTTPLTTARTAIAHDHWGRALVVDGGILVGMVGLSDLTGRPLAI
jgi:Zn-dependent protease/CBS domain-containing protein